MLGICDSQSALQNSFLGPHFVTGKKQNKTTLHPTPQIQQNQGQGNSKSLLRVTEEIMKSARFRTSPPGSIFLFLHFCCLDIGFQLQLFNLQADHTFRMSQALCYRSSAFSLNSPFTDFTPSALERRQNHLLMICGQKDCLF